MHAAMAQHYQDKDLQAYYVCNRQIHEAIVEAVRNPVLSTLYESVTARIRRARYVTPMTPPRWAVALQEHEAILNALRRRDGIGLAHILRAHLRHKREEVISAGFADDPRGRGEPTSHAWLEIGIGARRLVLRVPCHTTRHADPHRAV
jgi:DNA-binding GntR family transcriptional regulator